MSDYLRANEFCDAILPFLNASFWEDCRAPHERHAVEIVRDHEWSVRVTVNGTTTTVPFTSEGFARSFADGQAFRLGVQVAEVKKAA